MKYSAELQSIRNGKKIKYQNVIADGIIPESKPSIRFLIFDDESQVQFPMDGFILKFSADRSMAQKMAAAKNGK